MPIRCLNGIHEMLAHPPAGLPKSALVDVTVPSHSPVSLTFELTGHPRIIQAVQQKIVQYQER